MVNFMVTLFIPFCRERFHALRLRYVENVKMSNVFEF